MTNSTLTQAWLGLLALTAIGLAAGRLSDYASWLPLLVAALIWLKGWLVMRYFVNAGEAHPFVTWLLRIFTAFAPAALILTDALAR